MERTYQFFADDQVDYWSTNLARSNRRPAAVNSTNDTRGTPASAGGMVSVAAAEAGPSRPGGFNAQPSPSPSPSPSLSTLGSGPGRAAAASPAPPPALALALAPPPASAPAPAPAVAVAPPPGAPPAPVPSGASPAPANPNDPVNRRVEVKEEEMRQIRPGARRLSVFDKESNLLKRGRATDVDPDKRAVLLSDAEYRDLCFRVRNEPKTYRPRK